MKGVLVSNGHGEDGIAATLGHALLNQEATLSLSAIPLVGEGLSYQNTAITLAHTNKTLPSGGFISSPAMLWKDIQSGAIQGAMAQRKSIRNLSVDADFIIAVGDVYCLFWTRQAAGTGIPIYFLATAKSQTFSAHNRVERWMIRQYSRAVFPRDESTHDALRKSNLNSHYFGNPMMDSLIDTGPRLSRKGHTMIGILPGSRDEAYDNFSHLIQVCKAASHRSSQPIDFWVAKAPSLDIQALKKVSGLSFEKQNDSWSASIDTNSQVHISENFLGIINQSELILGLAGTANEQALYLGKTIICFEGAGPQSSLKRFKQQARLISDRLIVLENRDADHIAKTTIDTLYVKRDSSLKIGKSSNAAPRIATYILSDVRLLSGRV